MEIVSNSLPDRPCMRRLIEPAMRLRLDLREFGLLAAEVRVDVRDPQFEPAIEVLRSQRMPRVQREMQLQGVAAVEPRVEQHGLPEVAHDREVVVEVELRDVGEDRPDERVGERTAIERDDEVADVGTILQVARHVFTLSELTG